MLRWVLGVMLATPLGAQEVPGADPARVMQGLPAQTLKKLRGAPDKFIADAAGLILGFGGARGIDRDGIERFIALERARTRARVVADLMEADLDAGGAVAQAEVAVLMATLSARARGRLHLAHAAADGDGDGAVSRAELAARADAEAMARLDADEAEDLLRFLIFDLDGDGFVTLPEVSQAVAALRQPA